MGKLKYAVGTGWWCDGTGVHKRKKKDPLAKEVRSIEFFGLWYRLVKKYSSPSGIIVVDSNAPMKPDFPSDVEHISLMRNFYPPYYRGPDKVFGLSRSAGCRQCLLGATWAAFNDLDYFVWIEQDCVIHGDGIIEKAIDSMGSSWMMDGVWKHALKRETCFMIFRLHVIDQLIRTLINRDESKLEKRYFALEDEIEISHFPFGVGRSRPIDFDADHFYAQHLMPKELSQFLQLEGESLK
jgi:hypothetical protein